VRELARESGPQRIIPRATLSGGSGPGPGPALYVFGIKFVMQQTGVATSTTAGPASGPPRIGLPSWGIAFIAGVAVAALVFAAILQAEVASIHSEGSGLGSKQLFGGTVNVSQELAPGNASYGYWGSAGFQSPTGNGNPLAMQLTFLESAGVPVTLEFVVCSEVSRCGIRNGNLQLVSLTSQLSESATVLEPATGSYELYVLNLPGYTNGSPVVTFSVQVNVTLLGQVNLHS
jgi:hypothetical protein